MSGRYVRPSDQQSAISNKEIPMSDLIAILQPLEIYTTAYFMHDEKICIDRNERPNSPRMSHAEFVRRQVFPLLTKARAKFGDETVARELVEASLPAYRKLPMEKMCGFWDRAMVGIEDGGPAEDAAFARQHEGKLNPDLAAKIGVEKLLAPILELAVVHDETDVFGIDKFFVTHATRMGNVVTMFTYEDYLAYIELAKKLLHGGVFDWSIERDEEEWIQLTPIIRQFGLRPVIEPMVDVMVALSDIPGTKEEKYHYSFLSQTFKDLSPLLVALVLADESTDAVSKTLDPLVPAIRALHTMGAFQSDVYSRNSPEGRFFSCFGKKIRRIMKVGMEQTLRELSQLWAPRLIENMVTEDKD